MDDWEFCVVGSGPAGAVVAAKLAAAGRRVVLVEQGPRYTDADRGGLIARFQRRIGFADAPDFNDALAPGLRLPLAAVNVARPYDYGHLVGVGGTGLHFSGRADRPTIEDLEVRTRFGYGRDWPIAWDAFEPWLVRAERELGVAGGDDDPYASKRSAPYPMPAHPASTLERDIFAPACTRVGWKAHSIPRAVNSVDYDGRSRCLSFRACFACPSGARYSPDRVHVARFEALANAELRTNLRVRRLETNGGRVVAAHAVRTSDNAEVTITAKHFILAANAIETTRLLLLSSSPQNPHGLGNHAGLVGQGFADNFSFSATMSLGVDIGIAKVAYETSGSNHFRSRANAELTTFSLAPVPARVDPKQIRIDEKEFDLAAFRQSVPRTMSVYTCFECATDGKIELDPEAKDPFGDPLPRVTLEPSDRDRASFDRSLGAVAKLAEAMGAKSLTQDWESKSYGFDHHPSGGCRMAKSADHGVCDTDLRVFGTENLHLVTSGVFPHRGASSPTFQIVALGLRLVDHLVGGGS